ncbi:MAG: DUF1761 domain-containing protein [Hyphomicrobiales bacterium]|nr:DUF1761 domain-containing protein [Hyphomicrobiales bacterium]MCP4998440.1 DUF1761 domain-containing protein [Hyphomicrobiales bacterium]
MEEIAGGINWIAVVVGAVVSFLVGWLWYSPKLFGPKWAEGVGVEIGSASEMPVGAMVSQIVGLFLLSWFVGVTAAVNALFTVILATLAFAMLGYSGGMFRRNAAYAGSPTLAIWSSRSL